MTGFSSAELDDAVRLPDHREAVDRIKDLVIRQLRATDERASVRKTEYFNHSFVPDLVLDWRDENENRYVFLRPEAHAENLTQDLQLSQDVHPIFYSLSDIENATLNGRGAEIETSSRQADSLITDYNGLDGLVANRNEDPIVRLATSAVLQGARGVLDVSRANTLAGALTVGMNAAARREVSATGQASQTIMEIFDAKRSSRLNRLLQAVWVGSGGPANEFPGGADLSVGLDGEAISYLIRLDLIDDQKFWSRIGRKLNLEVLTRLNVQHSSPNFQMLINSNLDVISGRICSVVADGQVALDFETSETTGDDLSLQWEVNRGNLILRSPNFAAYVAERRETLNAPNGGVSRTTFSELTSRIESHRIHIAELTLRGQGRTVSYSSESEIDPVHERTLRAISEALGTSATVHSVVVLVPGHSPVTCDFRNSTISGNTSASYPITELIRISTALFVELSASEREALDALLASRVDDGPDASTLFGYDSSIS